MAIRLIDAQDGLRISIFQRHGKIYAYKLTPNGRFLRRVNTIRVEITTTLDYLGKKVNNIYIDTKIITNISIEDLYANYNKLEDILEHELLEKMTELFGSVITEMLTISGTEFFETHDEPEYPKINYIVLWKHHYTDNWRERRLEEIL